MKKIDEEIFDFMEDHLALYLNPHTVEITMHGTAICLASGWPDEGTNGDTYVGLWFECETIVEFIETFGITAVAHLGKITPVVLLDLYQRQMAEVFCSIDNPHTFYPLYFRKQNNTLLTRNDQGSMHEVHELLETPEQFIAYTLQHYQLAGMPGYHSKLTPQILKSNI